jgi:hypothetical protein
MNTTADETLYYLHFPEINGDRGLRTDVEFSNLSLGDAEDIIHYYFPQRYVNGKMLDFYHYYPHGCHPDDCHPNPGEWEFYDSHGVLFANIWPMKKKLAS